MKKILSLSAVCFVLAMFISITAFAMPSYDKAPDASTWGTEDDTFTAPEYLQTSALKSNTIGYRGVNTFQGGLYSSLRLPSSDTAGRVITWESSDPEVIATNGTLLKRPEKTKDVVMTAKAAPLDGEDAVYSKKFTFKVHADYALLDNGPGVKDMLIEENFYDGEYDSDIFEVTTSAGAVSEVKDGALVIRKTDNVYHGNSFKIWHTKDHKPITSGVYVEEFTWDKQNNANLGYWQEIDLVQANINKTTNEIIGTANMAMFNVARGDVGVGDGGKIRLYQNTAKYQTNKFWPLNWASSYRPNYSYDVDANGNQNNDNGRLPNNKGIHVKFVYNFDEGNFMVYMDGILINISGFGSKFDFLPQTGTEVDPDTLEVETYAPNAYYTQIIFDGNIPGEDVIDYMAISDYKFYEATDQIAVQFSTPNPGHITAFSNINTANVLFSRIGDVTDLGNGVTVTKGDKMKLIIASYSNSGTLTAAAAYDITVPGAGINTVSVNPYNSEALKSANKSKVRGFLWKDGAMVPICDSKNVEY